MARRAVARASVRGEYKSHERIAYEIHRDTLMRLATKNTYISSGWAVLFLVPYTFFFAICFFIIGKVTKRERGEMVRQGTWEEWDIRC